MKSCCTVNLSSEKIMLCSSIIGKMIFFIHTHVNVESNET